MSRGNVTVVEKKTRMYRAHLRRVTFSSQVRRLPVQNEQKKFRAHNNLRQCDARDFEILNGASHPRKRACCHMAHPWRKSFDHERRWNTRRFRTLRWSTLRANNQKRLCHRIKCDSPFMKTIAASS